MMKLWGVGAFLATLFLSFGSAEANVYSFNFLAYDSSYQVSGVAFTSNTSNPSTNVPWGGSSVVGFEIQSISGAVSGTGGGTITSVIPNPNQNSGGNNTQYGFIYDNNGFGTAPFLDLYGVLFTTAPSGSIWNLWGNSPTDYELYTYSSGAGTGVDVHGTMTVAAVPEASTWAMLLVGFAGIGFVAYRRNSGSTLRIA
jgi:hypothetical protein